MRKFVSTVSLIALFAFALTASAAPMPPGQNKLQCFDGPSELTIYGGACTLQGNGARGPATLTLDGTDPDGDYAGVYILDSTVYGRLLTDVTKLSYNYTASVIPQPGNLSYNLPIDSDANGSSDFYLFVDAFYCPGTDGTINIVSNPNCGVWAGGVTFYANWAAFVAAYPGAKVATDAYVFIVAERTPSEPAATYTVNAVKFGTVN